MRLIPHLACFTAGALAALAVVLAQDYVERRGRLAEWVAPIQRSAPAAPREQTREWRVRID